MPTDIIGVLMRNAKARTQTEQDIQVVLGSFILCLIYLVIIFADPPFALAVELLGRR